MMGRQIHPSQLLRENRCYVHAGFDSCCVNRLVAAVVITVTGHFLC